MITKDKLEIYVKYDGELDGLKIIGNPVEKEIINDKDWAFLYSLIQDLRLIEKGLVSKEFKSRIQLQINQDVENNAITLLNKIALDKV
jgi:hypothetical protein